MRGKALQGLHAHEQKGITPAHAGKSKGPARCPLSTGDHPRACGEKAHDGQLGLFDQGSPLRVRGKAQSDLDDALAAGITPACAGKRPLRAAVVIAGEDHPCVCGEKC